MEKKLKFYAELTKKNVKKVYEKTSKNLLTQIIKKPEKHNSFLQVMDTYCWIHSTFSVDSRLIGEDGYDRAHPGVAPPTDLDEGKEFRYHKYYQWVCFTLFFQALLFYIPR